MNTSSNMNSTPSTINRSKYIDSYMDFSTPMSTISNPFINNTTMKHLKQCHENISSDNNNKKKKNLTIFDQVLQKLDEHKINFHHTQNHLHLLDSHLYELKIVLNQLKHTSDYNSSFKTTTDHLQTRLLQMSIKQEQVRTAMMNFYQSPIISVRQSNTTGDVTNPMMHYTDLINALNSSINETTNSIERFYQEQHRLKHRTNDYHTRLRQRQELLVQLLEKMVEQQKTNEEFFGTININKPQFDNHREQLAEFDKLNEEFQRLQDENRLLKHKTKENIQTLYTSFNQLIE